jgi:uncharacterized protein (TIGR02246 family)
MEMAAVVYFSASWKEAAMTSEQQAIAHVLGAYEAAVNSGDLAGVTKLYAPDAVLLAPENPPAVGAAAVEAAYRGIFNSIALNIKFAIAEIHVLSADWAFLRSTSTGTITIKANGAKIPEGNQELFLLRKHAGQWKIARYAFSVTSPAG